MITREKVRTRDVFYLAMMVLALMAAALSTSEGREPKPRPEAAQETVAPKGPAGISPWDLYAAACLSNGMDPARAASEADKAMLERKRRSQ